MPRQFLALVLLDLELAAVVSQLEQVATNFVVFRDALPATDAEHAALVERAEAARAESQWLRDRVMTMFRRPAGEPGPAPS
jgi:tRNA A-37 threonylcarbamoyl transferase component Bud32